MLRGLEYFASVDAPRVEELADAVAVLGRARRKDGRWPTYRQYQARRWFELEPAGASRFNTARVLRVMEWWERGVRSPRRSR